MFIIKVSHNGESKTFESEKPELIVGRSTPSKKVDIDLTPDKKVSRKHLVLKIEYNMANGKNEAWAHDQGSSRGTILNGTPLFEPIKLEPDDRIEIGESIINVKLRSKRTNSFSEKVDDRKKKVGVLPPRKNEKQTASIKEPVEGNPVMVSENEFSPEIPMKMAASNPIQTECAGFVAYSIENLAAAVNRYARQNKMYPISSSVIQEGKGSNACFRSMVVFHVPPID